MIYVTNERERRLKPDDIYVEHISVITEEN